MRNRCITLLAMLVLSARALGEEGSPAGLYSNNAQGFKEVSVVLGENGTGFLSRSAGGGTPLREWSYTEATQEIAVEGPMGKEGKSETLTFRYNPEEKTLTPLHKWEGGVLRKSAAEGVGKYLRRWGRVADKYALEVAETVAKSDALKGDGVCVVTMNIEVPEVLDYIKSLGFSIEEGDEVFAISNIQKNAHVTVQIRKVSGEWKLLNRQEMH